MAAADSGSSDAWHVLLCCTGSVASLKVPELTRLLLAGPADGARAVRVQVVSTEHARHFFSPADLPAEAAHLSDADEWADWRRRGDPVRHVALRDWAHVLVVAPLDANTLAKLAHGLADNLVTCVARAWPVGRRPALLAPAMNTAMWLHPATGPQLRTLCDWGYTVAPPVRKTLVCGQTGVGAMADVRDIRDTVFALLRAADGQARTAAPHSEAVCGAADGQARIAAQHPEAVCGNADGQTRIAAQHSEAVCGMERSASGCGD